MSSIASTYEKQYVFWAEFSSALTRPVAEEKTEDPLRNITPPFENSNIKKDEGESPSTLPINQTVNPKSDGQAETPKGDLIESDIPSTLAAAGNPVPQAISSNGGRKLPPIDEKSGKKRRQQVVPQAENEHDI